MKNKRRMTFLEVPAHPCCHKDRELPCHPLRKRTCRTASSGKLEIVRLRDSKKERRASLPRICVAILTGPDKLNDHSIQHCNTEFCDIAGGGKIFFHLFFIFTQAALRHAGPPEESKELAVANRERLDLRLVVRNVFLNRWRAACALDSLQEAVVNLGIAAGLGDVGTPDVACLVDHKADDDCARCN